MNELTVVTSSSWKGRSYAYDLSDGDLITIRSYENGLMKAAGEDEKVKAKPYGSNKNLWYAYSTTIDSEEVYYFKNYEYDCHLATKSSTLKCRTGDLDDIDNKAYWRVDYFTDSDDDSDYQRVYTRLENMGNDKCPNVGSCDDTDIAMTDGACDTSASGFSFEILYS